MDTMRIKTQNGHMDIYLNNFFPATAGRCRKLFKIINEFSYLNDVQEMTERLNQHFTEQIGTLDARRQVCAKSYWGWRQKYVDYGNMVESGKHPNGVKLTKEELKDLKAKYRDAKVWAATYEREFKSNTKQLESYKKNLELLNQL